MATPLALKRWIRVTPVLMAVLGVFGPRAAAAQQAADGRVPLTMKSRTAPAPAPTVAPAVALLGPRLAPPVASVARPVLRDEATSRAFLTAGYGGRHTLVISTLSLVLIVVLIVLLI